jgi:hypothetical protein
MDVDDGGHALPLPGSLSAGHIGHRHCREGQSAAIGLSIELREIVALEDGPSLPDMVALLQDAGRMQGSSLDVEP